MNINLPELAVDLILNIINIIVLFVIVKALVYKPVKKFLDERTEKIKAEKENADKLRSEAEATLAERDKILAESKKEGERLSQKAYLEAKENAESIINDAKLRAKETERKADAHIKAEKEKLIASSKDDIADIAVSIAERILTRETSKSDNEKIIDEFFSSEG